jgi:hypothetical protein
MTSSGRRLICLALVAGCLVAGGLAAPKSATADEPSGGAGAVETFRLAPEPSGVAARDVPLSGDRLDRPLRTDQVDLLGLTWRGESGAIRVRTRSDGAWTDWRATTVLEDGPDRGSPEALGVSGTDLLWVGGADRVEVDVRGPRPEGLSLAMIGVGGGPPPVTRTAPPARGGNAFRPHVFGRDAWGADPRLRDGRPTYNRTIQQVHVHHTVSSNDYSAAEVPGLIRAMYRYHTVNLGWSDLGYNFLVDRFGRIWAGRAGGIRRAVRGAHTLGFNSTSTGVAVIGNFETARPGRKVRTALVHLAAWKLNKYDRNPRGRAVVFSHGSDRYRSGRRVRLPVIDGHRDTNQTACPGERLYQRLPGIRLRAARRIARYR